MSLNKVMLIGNVGKEPEVRYLDGNNASGSSSKVATLTLATTDRYRDRSNELKEKTEWHTIVAWGNLADLSEKYIHKGTQIYVEGKLTTRQWTDQSGNKRYTTEIKADNIQLLGRKSDNPSSQDGGGYQASQPYSRPAQPVQAAQPVPPVQAPNVDITDDLPF